MASRPDDKMTGSDYVPDDTLPDNSGAIMEVFGLEGNWGDAMNGVEAKSSGAGGDEGGAPSSDATPAAEGTGGAEPQPASTPQPSSDAGASQQPQQGQPGPAPASPAASAPAPAAQPQPTGESAELQTLKAQVQALQQMLSAAAQPQGQPQSGQPGTTASPDGGSAQPTAEELMNYNLGIPPDVLQAVTSEDPNTVAAGLNYLINSFGKVVHQRVMAHVDQLVAERLNTAQYQTQVSAAQKQMNDDYYGAYPAHNDPLNRLIVAQEAQAMWNENPTLAWDENTRNALGARVNAKLGLAAQPAQSEPQPGPAPAAPAPKPAAQMGASNRGSQGNGKDAGAEISSILNEFMG